MSSYRKAWKTLFKVLVYGIALFCALKGETYFRGEAQLTFRLFPLFIYQSVYPIIFGLLLAVPQFYREFFKEGSWNFEFANLIVIVPTMFTSILPILAWIPPLNESIFARLLASDRVFFQLAIVSGIVFGYQLLLSVKRNTLVACNTSPNNSQNGRT